LDSFTLITLQLLQIFFFSQSLVPSSNSKPLKLNWVTLPFSFYYLLLFICYFSFSFWVCFERIKDGFGLVCLFLVEFLR
jgi:hypothetical protein